MVGLSRPFFFIQYAYDGVLLPQPCLNKGGLGCSLFARHYWGNHCCFLFLRLLRCFSSPRMPLHIADNESSTHWVVPFGNPGIKGHLHLNRAYRSLSRPSSPPRAKASTGRPSLLFFALNYTSSFALLALLILYNFCEIVSTLRKKIYSNLCTTCQ